MEYEKKRELAKDFLLKTLLKHGLSGRHLKGSWKANDFHLSIDGNISYSDVDILVNGLGEFERERLIKALSCDLTEFFNYPISVSVHNRNSLYELTNSDAQILGIAEYIAQYKRIQATQSCSKNYIDTKFTLLLLRNSCDERYQDVSDRIGTNEAMKALDVKLGKENTFPFEYAKSLIEEFGNAKAIQFFNHCLLNQPNDDVAHATLSQLARCKTIDRWLHGYLTSKVNQYS